MHLGIAPRAMGFFMQHIIQLQRKTCVEFGAQYLVANSFDKVGVSKNFSSTTMPLNGLRHPPDSGTCGWFLWRGLELGSNDDFFVPLHLSHLVEAKSQVLPFLGLAPGWRFLTDGIYEDVWFDETLLDI